MIMYSAAKVVSDSAKPRLLCFFPFLSPESLKFHNKRVQAELNPEFDISNIDRPSEQKKRGKLEVLIKATAKPHQ